MREFADSLRRYRLSSVIGDRFGAEWVTEQFVKAGVQYSPAEKTRSELYLELLPGITSGQIELLDNPRLIAHFAGLERRTARGARDSVDHAPGAHDDLANSAAGALISALGSSGCYGLLDYFQGIQRGEILLPEEQVNVRHTIREDIVQWERPRTELYPASLEKGSPKPLRPCEKCGSNLMQQLGGARRCAQCGHQIFEGSYAVASRSRGGRPVLREVKWSCASSQPKTHQR